ncbi:MAG: type II secretion system F family protein [Nitrososphaerales archaeon]
MGNMRYIDDQWRYTAYVAAAILIFFSVIIGLIVGGYKFSPHFLVPTGNGTRIDGSTWTLFNKPWMLPRGGSASLTDTIIGIGITIGLMPVMYIASVNHRYLRAVESNIPRFLRDILESTDAGMILPTALIKASQADYGPISFEIGLAMTKFSLGSDYQSSLAEAGRRLKHPFAPQVCLILTEAYASGGRLHDVLSSSVTLFNGLEQYNQEKATELRPYTQLVYISVAIFLIIALIIVSQFIGPLQRLPSVPSSVGRGSIGFSGLTAIPPTYFESVFFITAIFEALFGGIVAGKIVDGSAESGLRHSIILLVLTILVFNAPILGIFVLQ